MSKRTIMRGQVAGMLPHPRRSARTTQARVMSTMGSSLLRWSLKFQPSESGRVEWDQAESILLEHSEVVIIPGLAQQTKETHLLSSGHQVANSRSPSEYTLNVTRSLGTARDVVEAAVKELTRVRWLYTLRRGHMAVCRQFARTLAAPAQSQDVFS